MWCARPGWKRCGGRPGCSTRRRSLAITSGVTGRRGSRDSVGSAASPRSTCGRRHAGRDAAQSEEDVNDNRIEDRSAVLLTGVVGGDGVRQRDREGVPGQVEGGRSLEPKGGEGDVIRLRLGRRAAAALALLPENVSALDEEQVGDVEDRGGVG